MANQHGETGRNPELGEERDQQHMSDRQQQNQGGRQGAGAAETESSGQGASEQNDHYGYQDGRDHDQERGER